MKKTIPVLITVLLTASVPAMVWGATCEPSDPKGTQCTLHVDEIRPTQFSVGSVAVDCKAEKISSKSKKKLRKYLKDDSRHIPAVIGPDGNFYMTDHHHLSTALYRAKSSNWKNKDKILHVDIIDKYSFKNTSWSQFWEEMQKLNRSYNYDNKGTPDMNFALLPKDVGGLLNDPYRTLSRWVRESCGYVKAGKEQCDGIRPDPAHEAPYFMEFYWGDFFRQNLPLSVADLKICKSIPYSATCLSNEVEQLKGIYQQAMTLAASKKAKQYFEAQELNPMAYGYNPTGEHLKLEFGGYKDACEEPVTQ